MNNNNKNKIIDFIKKNCIKKPKKDEYFFGKLPGARYKGQFYLASLLYDAEMQLAITEEFIKIIDTNIGNWNFQITGREWSSIPLLIFLPIQVQIIAKHNLNSFMIKRERKTYGIHNYIEGKPNKLPVLIVDDLFNSTDSFYHSSKVLKSKEVNLEILPYIFAILNKYSYDEKNAEYFDKYLGREYKGLSILTRDDLK